MRFEACRGYDAQLECGAQTNMAKLLSADASREDGNGFKKTSLFSAKCRSFIHLLSMRKRGLDTNFFNV